MTILEYVLKLERDSIDLYEKYLTLDYKKELKNVKYDSVLYEKEKKSVSFNPCFGRYYELYNPINNWFNGSTYYPGRLSPKKPEKGEYWKYYYKDGKVVLIESYNERFQHSTSYLAYGNVFVAVSTHDDKACMGYLYTSHRENDEAHFLELFDYKDKRLNGLEETVFNYSTKRLDKYELLESFFYCEHYIMTSKHYWNKIKPFEKYQYNFDDIYRENLEDASKLIYQITYGGDRVDFNMGDPIFGMLIPDELKKKYRVGKYRWDEDN